MAKGSFSRWRLLVRGGRILWLSQDVTGRPSAQGAERKDGGIIGKPGRRATVVQTLWTQTEACYYWEVTGTLLTHVSTGSDTSLRGPFDPMGKQYLIIRTYYADFNFQECSRLTEMLFPLSQQICGFADSHDSTSPSKISPRHFPPRRKWEKMMLDLAVRQHFPPEPADREWSLVNCCRKWL